MNKNNIIGKSLEHSYKDEPSNDLNARIMASVIKIVEKRKKQEKVLMILVPTILSIWGIAYLIYTTYPIFISIFETLTSLRLMYYIGGAIILGFVLLSDYFMKKARARLNV